MPLRERVSLYLFSVPVVFLSAIQSGDLLHLLIAEFETKQVKILPDMLRVGGAGDCNNAALEIPTEDDLCGGHAMCLKEIPHNTAARLAVPFPPSI